MKFEIPTSNRKSNRKKEANGGPKVAIIPPNYEERGYIISAKIPEPIQEEKKIVRKFKPITHNQSSVRKKRPRIRPSEINQNLNHEPIIMPEAFVTDMTYNKDRDEDGYLKIRFR